MIEVTVVGLYKLGCVLHAGSSDEVAGVVLGIVADYLDAIYRAIIHFNTLFRICNKI